MQKLTVINPGEIVTTNYKDTPIRLAIGDRVTYCGHMAGGNIRVEINGEQYIAHPNCFKETQ